MDNSSSRALPSINDTIIHALAKLVDDAQTGAREPTHSEIESCFERCGLLPGDPNRNGRPLGKEKRVRGALLWSLDSAEESGQRFVLSFIDLIRSKGGFRESSPNFVGAEPIMNLKDAFRIEGFELDSDGRLRPMVLDNLNGEELTEALASYVRRANRGADDAALLTGTGKDLLEATAAHVVEQIFGGYSFRDNFPMLLGQAFTALELKTPADPPTPSEPPQSRLQRALYDAALAVNSLRNKQGTGHGRPWLPTVTEEEARVAVQTMSLVAGMLLRELRRKQAVRP